MMSPIVVGFFKKTGRDCHPVWSFLGYFVIESFTVAPYLFSVEAV